MQPSSSNPLATDSLAVSIIIVSYHTREKLRRCLAALGTDHEIIVVDNASTDGSPEMVEQEFPHVQLIRSETNLGFSVANNRGAAIARNPLHLFLNSDAYAEPGAVDKLANFFQSPQVAAAGGRLLNPDGSLQDSTARRLTLAVVLAEQVGWMKLINRIRPGTCYWTTALFTNAEDPIETDQVMGACVMIRAEPQPWNEEYFLYCEDTDLCHRLGKQGKILYVPTARFTHELGSSSGRHPWRGIARYNAGKELYFRRHHGPIAGLICFAFDRLGASLRLLGALLTLRTNAVKTWIKVLTAPYKGPKPG
jgi:GT2 family glycosyltransferase